MQVCQISPRKQIHLIPPKTDDPKPKSVTTPSAVRSNSHAAKRDELRLLINSHHPILTIETPEEERVEQLLFEVAMVLAVPLFTWSVTTGLARYRGAPIYNSETPEAALSNMALVQGDGIFLLRDFSRYCDNDKVCRRLRELAEQFRMARRSIVITAGSITLPPELEGDAASFTLGLPHVDELLSSVKQTLAELNRENQVSDSLDLAESSKSRKIWLACPVRKPCEPCGCACSQPGRRILRFSPPSSKPSASRFAATACSKPFAAIRSFSDIAGLSRLRDWIGKRKSALTPGRPEIRPGPAQRNAHHRSARLRQELGRAKPLPASGALNWRGWTPARSTTNSSAKVKKDFARLLNWLRKWLRWCYGSTRLKKPSPRPAPAAMPTPDFPNACLQPC